MTWVWGLPCSRSSGGPLPPWRRRMVASPVSIVVRRKPSNISVIAVALAHAAAEDVVVPERVAEDDRQDRDQPDQQEGLRLRRRGGVPDRDVRRDDEGEEADGDARIGENEERSRKGERQIDA